MAGELKLRQKHRLPSYWTSGHDLKAGYGIDRSAALLNAANGELHPVKLARGLMARAVSDGMELVTPADVQEIAAHRLNVRLVLDGEHAANAATSEVQFGLRSVAGHGVEGVDAEGIAIDEASRFYLPTRSTP